MSLTELLVTVPGWVPIGAPVAIAVIGGVWAHLRLRQSPRVDRPDLPGALRAAKAIGLLAAVVGAALFGLGAMIGMAWAGGANPVVVISFAALGSVAGLVAWLAALAGYAALARPRVGRVAMVGLVAGPIVVLSTMTILAWGAQAVASARYQEQADAEQARIAFWLEQSTRLHLTISDAEYDLIDFTDEDTGAHRTGIERVRLRLVLRADVDLPVTEDAEANARALVLHLADPSILRCILEGAVPTTGISLLPAATDITIDAEVAASAACMNYPEPGLFDVRLSLATSKDGYAGSYSVLVPLVIPAR